MNMASVEKHIFNSQILQVFSSGKHILYNSIIKAFDSWSNLQDTQGLFQLTFLINSRKCLKIKMSNIGSLKTSELHDIYKCRSRSKSASVLTGFFFEVLATPSWLDVCKKRHSYFDNNLIHLDFCIFFSVISWRGLKKQNNLSFNHLVIVFKILVLFILYLEHVCNSFLHRSTWF